MGMLYGLIGSALGGMLVPALLYALWSDHTIWYPVNLLAGMVLPGMGAMTTAELEQFGAAIVERRRGPA